MTSATANSLNKKRVDLLYLILGCSGALLLTNKIPLLAIGATILTLLLGLLAWLLRGKILKIWIKPLVILVCLYGYLIGSYIASGQSLSAMTSYQFLKHDGNFFFAYAMFFAFASPYLNFRALFSFYHSLLLFVFVIFAILGLAELVTRASSIFSSWYFGEFYFTALNKAHNATGSAYAAAATVALSLWIFGNLPTRKRKKCLIVLGVCLIGLLMTRSRGSVVAFGLTATFLSYYKYGLRFLVSRQFILVALFLALVTFATGAQHRLAASVRYEEDYNIVSRFMLWDKAWRLFKQSPLIGIGFGRYNDIDLDTIDGRNPINGYRGVAALRTNIKPVYDDAHAHNSYLHFLAESGIIGLGLLLMFWKTLYSRFKSEMKTAKDGVVKSAAALGMANIVLLMTLSLTENYMSSTTIMLFMSASTSICLGLVGQARERNSQQCV